MTARRARAVKMRKGQPGWPQSVFQPYTGPQRTFPLDGGSRDAYEVIVLPPTFGITTIDRRTGVATEHGDA